MTPRRATRVPLWAPDSAAGAPAAPRLGLRANLAQFGLLVLINAFVGGMVGLERAVLPLIAERDFGLASRSVILSFLISFGIVKALTNLVAGRYAGVVGRKRLLVAGWLVGLPHPASALRASVCWPPSIRLCGGLGSS